MNLTLVILIALQIKLLSEVPTYAKQIFNTCQIQQICAIFCLISESCVKLFPELWTIVNVTSCVLGEELVLMHTVQYIHKYTSHLIPPPLFYLILQYDHFKGLCHKVFKIILGSLMIYGIFCLTSDGF